MKLNELADNQGARKNRIRVGRGIGCGKGKTCGRGVKGQKSRTGVAIKGFEGGQMPIHRRLPKRGFHNYNRKTFAVVNLKDLQKAVDEKKLDAKKEVNREALVAAGLVRANEEHVKLLAQGELKTGLTLVVDKASKAAEEAVTKAGGKVTVASAEASASKAAKNAAKPKKGEA